jgi:SAM-dependent methyltransferase
MNSYKIKPNYKHREDPLLFDDSHNSDNWQYEVYQLAYTIANVISKKPVLDIGCGSGYKLVNIFKDFQTIGIELKECYKYLIKNYPDRIWMIKNQKPLDNIFGVVILADVIEHLINPTDMLDYIKNINFEYLVISTPYRDHPDLSQDGPPNNKSHVREWTLDEFNEYIKEHFDIINHFMINKHQKTQCMICKKYNK